MASRFQNAVLYSGLSCAAVYGGWLVLRSGFGIGAYAALAEGERFDGDARGARRVVWENPRELPFDVPDLAAEGRPVLSPDGRLLVFARGERGGNSDLWAADVEQGIVLEPRPLALLATPADELAPCIAAGWLWFASDRETLDGDLDLWRVRFEEDVLGEAERAPAHLNSPAQDTEPAVLDDGRLVFASNRGSDPSHYDLFLADPGVDSPPEALSELCTGFDERDPAVAAGALWFASDRHGSFELYRSFLHEGVFLAEEAQDFASAPPSLRAPSPSPDGFELHALALSLEGTPKLVRSASRELVRVPGPGVTRAELLVVAAFLLLALLAWLARRGAVLDLLLKCYLLSLLVHLLLLLVLRHARPESEIYGPGVDEPLFRVQLEPAPEERPSALLERAGELDLARADGGSLRPMHADATAVASESAPGALDLEAPAARERASPPLPRTFEAPPSPEHSVIGPATLALPESGPAPEDLGAPVFELASSRLAAEPAASAAGAPARASPAAPRSAGIPEASPSLDLVLAPAANDAESAAPSPTRIEASAGFTPAESPGSLAPAPETFEVRGSAAPTLALERSGVVPEPGPRDSTPSRATSAVPSDRGAPDLGAGPAPLAVALEGAAPSRREDAPMPAANAIERSAALRPSDLPLRVPDGNAAGPDPSASAAPRFDATAGLAAAGRDGEARASGILQSAPSRAGQASGSAATPLPQGLDLTSVGRGDSSDVQDALPAPASLVRQGGGGPGLDVALQLPPSESSPPESGSSAPRFDATEGLAQGLVAVPSGQAEAQVPARAATQGESDLALAPAAFEIAALPRSPASTDDDTPPRAELDDTPYRNRFGPAKLRALEEHGGSAETERAVALGLAYLARVQQRDGSFGSAADRDAKYRDVRVGKTGLALLAFLGAGHTQSSASEYSDTVGRALDWLRAEQDPRGHIGDSEAYGHGIATYALSECFAMTQDEALRGSLERAVARVAQTQDQRADPRLAGGWSYYFREPGAIFEGDDWPRASVSAWQIMALESARLAGIDVPDSAFDAARRFLLRLYDPGHGAFRYDHDPQRLASGYPILPASTPAALFCLSLLGVDLGAPELAQARRFVLARAPRDYARGSNDDFVFEAKGNVYFWYYASLAMFRVGGREWERWNVALQEALLPSQDPDGSWQPVCVYSEYAGDDEDDKSYTTAMNVLSLEVYYRYFTPLLSVR